MLDDRRRRYCTPECRTDTRNSRRRARAAWHSRYRETLRLRAAEATGTLLPLPGMPALPEPPPCP